MKGIQEIIKLIYLRLAISTAITIFCHWTHGSTMINMVTTLLVVHPIPPHIKCAEKAQLFFVSHSLLIHNLLQLLLKEAFPICLLRCLHHLKKIHPQALGLRVRTRCLLERVEALQTPFGAKDEWWRCGQGGGWRSCGRRQSLGWGKRFPSIQARAERGKKRGRENHRAYSGRSDDS